MNKYVKYLHSKYNNPSSTPIPATPLLIYTSYIRKFQINDNSCFSILKKLKDPEFNMNTKLPIINMTDGGDNSCIENLCYYLAKQDNLILLEKVYQECVLGPTDISWFIINMFNFTIPGSNIYNKMVSLINAETLIGKISGFPLLYELSIINPSIKNLKVDSEAFKLMQILQKKDITKITSNVKDKD